ncbi:MAG: MqnA/MqnD/SBP family protein, partial [Chitinophagaceae bacterium]
AGGALGKGVGPLLISKYPVLPNQLSTSATISLPGEHTTAHLLFSWAFPKHQQKEFRLFSSIEEAISTGKTDLGVIIHENRFTYQAKGLHLVSDLGHLWEQQTQLPIPLGAIAAKRSLPIALRRRVEQHIRESIRWSYQQTSLSPFILAHAQELSPSIIQQHIDLYVNEFSLSMGEQGRQAVRSLMDVYARCHTAVDRVDDSALFS